MLELYYWPTPNGQKITIALEELGLPYRIIPVDITAGAQHEPAFLAISPNNKMPALVDSEAEGSPLSIFESGAILVYLAEKTGQLMPSDVAGRSRVLQWLFWQMGGLGPMMGQANHFVVYAGEKVPYAITRYTNEVKRLFVVMERQLSQTPFLAGDYSIADIAAYPWAKTWRRLGLSLESTPAVARWLDAVGSREAVKRGMGVKP